ADHGWREGSCVPEDQSAELVSICARRHPVDGRAGARWRGYGLDLYHAALHALSEHPRHYSGAGDFRGGLQFDLYRPELYRDDPPHALPGHDVVPAAALRLVELRRFATDGIGHPGSGDHAGPGAPGARLRYRRLRSDQGRGP